jgi:ABC-type uncharacterized transport system involved in gliding motility auxiliary subunit
MEKEIGKIDTKNIAGAGRKRRQSFTVLFFSILILVAVNVIAAYVFFRIDLTSEKRYSLSPSTADQLNELDDVVYVTTVCICA